MGRRDTIILSSLLIIITTISVGFPNVVHSTDPSSLCSQTPYPEVCMSLLPHKQPQTTNNTIWNVALGATLARVQSAYDNIAAIDTASFNNLAKLAWADCVELYEDMLYKVGRSSATTNTNDAQTWVSAAITNHQTCANGFADFQLSSNWQPFQHIASDLIKHLSTSLSIINKLATASSPPPRHTRFNVARRRLLAAGFPGWLSRADRMLLRANVAKSRASIVVAQDGSGHYDTVSQALVAAAELSDGTSRLIIYVKKGVYEENVVVTKYMNNFMVVGDGIDATIITGNRSVRDNGTTTFHSATFAVIGDGFMARDVTFVNTAGPHKHQAVAFRSGSDLSVLHRCSFKGYQDTLYVYSQRQYYRHCDIYGTLDFIFGDAIAVFQNCTIYVRKPMTGQDNFVTAQGRSDPNQNTGIVILNSHVTATSDLRAVPQGSFRTYLGRPWQKYSRTVFLRCTLDSIIDPAGWVQWIIRDFGHTMYYGEYMNTGPGAKTSGRLKCPGYHVITSAVVAQKLSVADFLSCVMD